MPEMDPFESKLLEVFLRRPAPPRLKQRILDERARLGRERRHRRVVFWQRLAAGFALAAALGGGITWRHAEEARRGALARQEVLTALRVTNQTLERIRAQLSARDRDDHAAGDRP
jgi:hypothetical protein